MGWSVSPLKVNSIDNLLTSRLISNTTMSQHSQRSLVVNDALLRDFVDGKLDASLELKVAEFVEARPALQEKVASLSNDGFLDRVKQAAAAEPAPSVEKPKASRAVKKKQEADPSAAPSDIPEELANYSPYKVIRELGRGGMGVVYLAKNIEMDRLEVLKVPERTLVGA